jgi:hypothetical protein
LKAYSKKLVGWKGGGCKEYGGIVEGKRWGPMGVNVVGNRKDGDNTKGWGKYKVEGNSRGMGVAYLRVCPPLSSLQTYVCAHH